MKKIAFFLFIAFLTACSSEKTPKYRNPAVSVDERVKDLVKRMTLEEKVAQLQAFRGKDTVVFDSEGNFVAGADSVVLYHGAGAYYARGFRRDLSMEHWVKCYNSLQKFMIERTRLGIPLFFFGEALHGYMAPGATSFPQAIALGCTWDTALVEKVFTAAALEASARGTRQVLSPVLDLARDPRWGRTEECYSEDPYLVSRLGMAAVFGFQGRGKTIDHHHVAVTLKHFAGHGQPEGGRNIAPVNYSEREFRENHLYPFEMAIKKSNAQSVMVSYNEWDGVPNHVNHRLLTDILRKEWGFKGFVMSDGGGMNVTYQDHRAAADSAESGILSIRAGLDYDLSSNGCFMHLADQVRKGLVSEKDIDRAVSAVLRVKFISGLFDHPYLDADTLKQVTNCRAHKALAREAAQKAMVLLKNENNTLPFDEQKIRTLAVIGPNAAAIRLGGYTPPPNRGISVLDGIREFADGKFTVLYAEGCKLTLNKEVHWLVNENPVMNNPENDRKLIDEAVQIAGKSDAVVLVLGENEMICREAWADFHRGDRDDLNLAGMQNELARAILSTGKPVAVVLLNGRPISINEIAEKAPAIIEGWYLGEETGRAVTDVLFGKVNPSGKLSVTIPRSVGQLPCFYNHKPSRFRNYVLAESSPLFPFGYGLSYTTYEYKNLRLVPVEIRAGETALVSVDVTNSGKVAGEEIVQLYIRDVISLPTRPVMELKDFTRIALQPGETKTVTFRLTPDKLEAFNLEMKREIQPGEFEVMVGRSSVDYLKTLLKVR